MSDKRAQRAHWIVISQDFFYGRACGELLLGKGELVTACIDEKPYLLNYQEILAEAVNSSIHRDQMPVVIFTENLFITEGPTPVELALMLLKKFPKENGIIFPASFYCEGGVCGIRSDALDFPPDTRMGGWTVAPKGTDLSNLAEYLGGIHPEGHELERLS